MKSISEEKTDLEQQQQFVNTHIRALNIQSEDEHTRWVSCCFKIDRGILFFIAQLAISLMVLFFCVYQLTQDNTAGDLSSRQFYSGTISFLVGCWLPSPRPK